MVMRTRPSVLVASLAALCGTGALGAQEVRMHVPGSSPIEAGRIEPFFARYSSFEITVRETSLFGREILSLLIEIAGPQGVVVDHMGWDAATLELLYRHTPYFAKGLEYVVFQFEGGKYEITRIPLEGGDPVFVRGDAGAPVFDQVFHGITLSALPLGPGYAVRLPYLAAQSDSDDWVVGSTAYRVSGRENVTTPAGAFDTWVVEATNPTSGNERLYLVHEPPYVVRRIRWVGTSRESVTEVLSVDRGAGQ